jgi:hypothetical protein
MHSGGPLFTFQCWVYPTSMPGSGEERAIFTTIDGTANVGISLRLTPNNSTSSYFSCYITRGSAGTYVFNSASSGTVPLNAWSHIALVYDQSLASNNGIFYINGVQSGTGNKTGSSVASSDASYSGRIGAYQVSESITYNFRGFISDLKISNTADSIVLPTKPLLPDSNTKLLTLQTRAPSQNINFIDSSPNEFLVTRSGNTTQGTFSPFSPTGWSGYFSGSNSLSVASNAAFAIGTGDFSFECWIYFSGTARGGGVSGELFGSTTTGAIVLRYLSGTLAVSRAGTADDMSASVTLTSGQWYHICVARTGTTGGLYLNGNRVAVNNSYTASYAQGDMQCISGTNGYFSNCRLIKGSNPYGTGSTINVPTAPLTAISGTSLLICQSNRFVDNGPNSFTITLANSPSIQAFSPFAPQNAVSPLVTGGSGYFSGGSLTIPHSPVLNLNSVDFCIEGWVYLIGAAATIAQKYVGGNVASSEYYFAIDGTNQLSIAVDGGGGEDYFRTSANTITSNAWNHCVVTRVGNAFRLFINGVLQNYSTSSRTLNATSTGFTTAGGSGNYISSLRIVKGTIPDQYQTVATTTGIQVFTPPTGPLTAIPGTQLLLNFTNGAAVDATGRNVLESVGNVHTTRAQAKFDQLIGGSSLAFDGTDYVLIPSNTNFGYGTGDLTIEFWMYWTGSGTQSILSNLTNDPSVNPHFYIGSGVLKYFTNGADRITGPAISTGQWYHIALSKASGTTRLFVNGTQSGSNYSDSNNYGTSAPLAIGSYYQNGVVSSASTFTGYIQNLRITKAARYTTGTGANANQMVFNGTNVLALPTAPFPRG